MTAQAPETIRCRVCGASAPADAARCPSCSAALGELAPCPHCRAVAGASPDAELRLRCDVCGGPRVPPGKGWKPSGREVPHLRDANRARKGRAAWRAAGVGSGLLVPLIGAIFLLLALVFGLGIKLLLTGAIVLGPLIGLAAFAYNRARSQGRVIPPAIDAAWLSVAADAARATGGVITPAELAQKLGVDEGRAEELSAQLDADAVVAPVRVPVEAPRARIGAVGDAAATAEREAEAEAEAQAARLDAAKPSAKS